MTLSLQTNQDRDRIFLLTVVYFRIRGASTSAGLDSLKVNIEFSSHDLIYPTNSGLTFLAT